MAQSRRYLNYAVVGVGTLCVSQCHKLQSKSCSIHTTETLLKQKSSGKRDARLEKTSLKQKVGSKFGLEKTVEDLIQQSMSTGEFKEFSGFGKPLPAYYPHEWDSNKPHELFDDHGLIPEWITAQKEIREDLRQLRHGLSKERSYLGPFPLSSEETEEWKHIISTYRKLTEEINKKIDKFNLIVPIMNKQMIRVNLNREAEKILINGLHSHYRCQKSLRTDSLGRVLSFFEEIFFGKWKKYTS